MRKLKACLISHSHLLGGSERSLLNLADYLVEQNVEVKVIVRKKDILTNELEQRDIGYEILSLERWTETDTKKANSIIEDAKKVAEQIKKWDSDVVYTNTSVLNIGAIASSMCNIPHVQHVREFGKEDHDLEFILPFSDRANFLKQNTNFLIFNSNAVRKKYKPYIDFKKSEVVYNYVNSSFEKRELKPAPKNSKVDIIIPFYNDPFTIKCMETVIDNFSPSIGEVLLIDDLGDDEKVRKEVIEFIKTTNGKIKYLKNKERRGFVANINKGFSLTKNDVIILNTDTLVTKNWVEKMKQVAYQEEKIATVTPLSNNASIFSVPKWATKNEDSDPERTNKILEDFSTLDYTEIPTGHGFCMFFKRTILEEIGPFDIEAFGKGYGEENDYSMRAYRAGYKNVLSARTYIYHEGAQSFGEEKKKTYENHYTIIKERYPEYRSLLAEFNDVRNPLQSNRIIVDYFQKHPELVDAKKAIILGNVFRNKGQFDAVKAVSKVIDSGRELHLLIVGPNIDDKDYLNKIKEFSKEKNIEKYIHLLGFLKQPSSLVQASDIFLMCSSNEAFGRVSIEAMYAKTPVIGSNSGGTPEIVVDKKTGLLYEPEDIDQLAEKIIYLLDNPKKAKKITSNAFDYAKKTITQENYGGKILKILNKVSKEEHPNHGWGSFVNLFESNQITQTTDQIPTDPNIKILTKEYLKQTPLIGPLRSVKRFRERISK